LIKENGHHIASACKGHIKNITFFGTTAISSPPKLGIAYLTFQTAQYFSIFFILIVYMVAQP
jgi:hypothetical protein